MILCDVSSGDLHITANAFVACRLRMSFALLALISYAFIKQLVNILLKLSRKNGKKWFGKFTPKEIRRKCDEKLFFQM